MITQAKSETDDTYTPNAQLSGDEGGVDGEGEKSTEHGMEAAATTRSRTARPAGGVRLDSLYEGVLLQQLEDVVLVVELGHVDGRLPVQVLQRPA